MLRGATRGAFLSARQLRRAATKKRTGRSSPPGVRGGAGGGRRDLGVELLKDEGAFSGQQRRAFGRSYADAVPRAMAVGALGLLDTGAVDIRIPSLDALLEDDDDGR